MRNLMELVSKQDLKNAEVLYKGDSHLKIGFDGTPEVVTHMYKSLPLEIEMRTTHDNFTTSNGENHDYTIVDFAKKGFWK